MNSCRQLSTLQKTLVAKPLETYRCENKVTKIMLRTRRKVTKAQRACSNCEMFFITSEKFELSQRILDPLGQVQKVVQVKHLFFQWSYDSSQP